MDGGNPNGDYLFSVFPNTTLPFGPITKENLDVTLLIFDFSCWLNAGESLISIAQPAVQLEGSVPILPWQNDYPLDNTTVTQPPPDAYPLTVLSSLISYSDAQAQIRVSAGTPGLNYVVSVVVTTNAVVNDIVQARRKQVDCLVTIEVPLNPNMVSASVPDTMAISPITINNSMTLPLGYDGRVYVQNTSGGPITVTLPVSPSKLQRIAPVDINGNAAAQPITYAASPGNFIYGTASFISNVNHDDLIFEWVGSHWIVLSSRYTFLG